MPGKTVKTNANGGEALILFGHGSRDPLWAKPMEAVAAQARSQRPGVFVTCAYLELTEPDLATVCREAAARGVQRITVLPMFLGQGRHAREDLPLLIEQQRQHHPQMAFTLRTALGEDPEMVDAIARWTLRGLSPTS